MYRVILTCVLTVLLAPSLAARDTAGWRQDVWLADNDINPCDVRLRRCDYFLRRIYDEIIDARERGDAEALEQLRRRLYWRYMSNPENRPAAD